jgi:hypothetical protein
MTLRLQGTKKKKKNNIFVNKQFDNAAPYTLQFKSSDEMWLHAKTIIIKTRVVDQD